MQKHTPDGVTLHCDFCGKHWDMIETMIEGHHGSILCTDCLIKSIDEANEITEPFKCTLCLRDFEPGDETPGSEKAYAASPRPEGANEAAKLCWDCIRQADRAFASDAETPWERRIEPDKRWR